MVYSCMKAINKYDEKKKYKHRTYGTLYKTTVLKLLWSSIGVTLFSNQMKIQIQLCISLNTVNNTQYKMKIKFVIFTWK